MGQAKQRGTREDRIAQARQRVIDDGIRRQERQKRLEYNRLLEAHRYIFLKKLCQRAGLPLAEDGRRRAHEFRRRQRGVNSPLIAILASGLGMVR